VSHSICVAGPNDAGFDRSLDTVIGKLKRQCKGSGTHGGDQHDTLVSSFPTKINPIRR